MKNIVLLTFMIVIIFILAACSNMPGYQVIGENVELVPVHEMFDYSLTDNVSDEVLIKSNHSLEELLDREGSYIIDEWPELDWTLVRVPEKQDMFSFIERLKVRKEVILVEPNMAYELHNVGFVSLENLSLYDDQWGLKNINAEAAWEITKGDPNVIVAIVDTGVDMNHIEFTDKIFIGEYDTTGDGMGDIDVDGHGTHVAGIAAASAESGNIAGVTWESPIMPIRVMDDYGGISTNYLVEAMYYLGDFAENNPDYRVVANMSIGGRGYSFAFKDAIDYAADRGVLLVASAGNDSKRVLNYPAAYNGVLTVAASTPYDLATDFSTIGYWNSVAAPGERILSTVLNDGYEKWEGTSMSSPFVTGAAALLLAENRDLSPVQIMNQIEQTADGVEFTEELGYGILDVGAMLGEIAPMEYGTLHVQSNIDNTTAYLGYGVITIFDSNGLLINHGSTGKDGNHIFSALKSGNYTINLSVFGPGVNFIDSKAVNIRAGTKETIEFHVDNLPDSIYSEELFTLDINEDEYYFKKEFDLNTGFYEFITSEYQDIDFDTNLYVYDSDNNLIASHIYGWNAYLYLYLEEGTYTVVIEDYYAEYPLNCTFVINQFIAN
ncbi:S8 family serine peptidase [Natronospora cellulosivora (SeqCode)]